MSQLSLFDLNRLKLDATKEAADLLRIDAATINNGLTVQTSVPPNAKFTDTVYEHPDTHPVAIITGLHSVATSGSYNDLVNKPANLPANGGNSDTVDSCHVNDNLTSINALWTSKKIQDKLNEKENTIVFSGTIKPTKDCVWIDTTSTIYTNANARFTDIKDGNVRVWHIETNDFQVKTKNNSSTLRSDLEEVNRLIGTKADNVVVTQSINGIMSKEDKTKLDGVDVNANKYIHPDSHPASMITGLPTKLPANGGNSDTVGGKSVNDESAGNAYLWTAGKIQVELNKKANLVHDHDDRYYTESEMNTKLNAKSDTSHGHNNYLQLSGGTMTGRILSAGRSTSWQEGSKGTDCIINQTTYTGWFPIIRAKSTNGAWTIGNYAENIFYLNYTSDTTMNGSSNTCDAQIRFFPTGNIITPGTITGSKVYNAIFNDYAEWFEKNHLNEKFEPGDLITIGDDNKYTKSTKAYDSCVVGVYSDSYGHIVGGEQLDNMEDNIKKFIPIGLSGRVSVKLIGKIKKGDLIVSSNISGVAMKMENFIPGTIIGKAVEDKNEDEIKRVKMLIFNS